MWDTSLFEALWRPHDDDRGVSPVVGTILLILLSIVLVTVLSHFVFGLGDPNFAKADVHIAEQPTGIQVQLASVERAESVTLRAIGANGSYHTYNWSGNDVGDMVRLTGFGPGSSIVVIAHYKGESTVVRDYTVDRGPNATGAPRITPITLNPTATGGGDCPHIVRETDAAWVDYNNIQPAVDNQSCSTILIYDGTYTETVNVHRPVTFQTATGTTPEVISPTGATDPVFGVNADNVGIHGLTVKADGVAGIRVNGHADFTLTNTTVEAGPGSGPTQALQLRAGSHAEFIQNNTFADATVGTELRGGTEVTYYRRNTIQNTETGLRITGEQTNVLAVRNNTITDAATRAGSIDDNAYVKLYMENTVSNSGPQYVNNSTVKYITANSFTDMAGGGLLVWDSLVETVSRNTFKNIYAVSPGSISNTENVHIHALYLRNSTSISVSRNRISGVAESAVTVFGGSVERINHNWVRNSSRLILDDSGDIEIYESLFVRQATIGELAYNNVSGADTMDTADYTYEIKLDRTKVTESVHHNVIFNSTATVGLSIHQPVATTVVRRNTIRDSNLKSSGIHVYQPGYKPGDSIYLRRNLISQTGANYGVLIALNGYPANLSRIHIHRNSINDVGDGICRDTWNSDPYTGTVQAQYNYFNNTGSNDCGLSYINTTPTTNPNEPSPVGAE